MTMTVYQMALASTGELVEANVAAKVTSSFVETALPKNFSTWTPHAQKVYKELHPKLRTHYASQISKGSYDPKILKHIKTAKEAKNKAKLLPPGSARKKNAIIKHHAAQVKIHDSFDKAHLPSLKKHINTHNLLQKDPMKKIFTYRTSKKNR